MPGPAPPAGRGVALPERHPADLARRRRHQHPVVGDVLDAPRRRTEEEHVTHARLVDHLLVEFADPAARAVTARRETRRTGRGRGSSRRS